VATVRRLQAAHALFTALEYTNDPIEILNDQFKLLVKTNYLIDRYLSNLITKFKRFKHNKILEKLCLRFQIIILKRNITIKKLFLLYEIVLDLNYFSFLLSLKETLIFFFVYYRKKYANSAFEKLTGLTLSEVSGKDFCSIHRIEANEQQLHKHTTTPGNVRHVIYFPYSLFYVLINSFFFSFPIIFHFVVIQLYYH
jgi:PAS domain-containing protein